MASADSVCASKSTSSGVNASSRSNGSVIPVSSTTTWPSAAPSPFANSNPVALRTKNVCLVESIVSVVSRSSGANRGGEPGRVRRAYTTCGRFSVRMSRPSASSMRAIRAGPNVSRVRPGWTMRTLTGRRRRLSGASTCLYLVLRLIGSSRNGTCAVHAWTRRRLRGVARAV